MCLPKLLFPVFLPPLWNFHVFFFQRISSPLFLIARSSPFSVIHVSVNIKNNVEKRLDFAVVFSLQKHGWPCDFLPNKTFSLHLGCYTCCLSYFIFVCMWCGRTDRRSGGGRWTHGHVTTKISRMLGHQIYFLMVLRWKNSAISVNKQIPQNRFVFVFCISRCNCHLSWCYSSGTPSNRYITRRHRACEYIESWLVLGRKMWCYRQIHQTCHTFCIWMMTSLMILLWYNLVVKFWSSVGIISPPVSSLFSFLLVSHWLVLWRSTSASFCLTYTFP